MTRLLDQIRSNVQKRLKFLRQIWESFAFAWGALRVNLVRTLLSLSGVTIGIFAIIAVFAVVDSLEKNIKESLEFLGSDNINIDKWPYGFSGSYPWWKYWQRPNPVYEEYQFLRDQVKNMQDITIIGVRPNAPIKYENNSSPGSNLVGVAQGYRQVFDAPITSGRYFTSFEFNNGSNVAVIGAEVHEELFPHTNPLGKSIKVKGLKYSVIGTLEKEGESVLGTRSNDEAVLIPYKSFVKQYYAGSKRGVRSTISVKGLEDDYGLLRLESELRALMRIKRGLKPRQEDNFALNRPEAISNFLSATFNALWWGGWIIGGFSILVGGFGIANIMFVSVKERTPIIGIQKSLGAKDYFILSQFLFESVFLSMIGGIVGILLVYLLSFVELGALEVQLSSTNILIGLGVSALVGTLSGIVPAATASRLDPVEAIRAQ